MLYVLGTLRQKLDGEERNANRCSAEIHQHIRELSWDITLPMLRNQMALPMPSYHMALRNLNYHGVLLEPRPRPELVVEIIVKMMQAN